MHPPFTLLNAWNGDVAFQLLQLPEQYVGTVHHLSTYTVVWVQEGESTCQTDFCSFPYLRQTLHFFAPYQHFCFSGSEGDFSGWAFRFSNEFFCLERHRKEVACNGLLFNNPYDAPALTLAEGDVLRFSSLTEQMLSAFSESDDLVKADILVSYLKILLVYAGRIFQHQRLPAPEDAGQTGSPYTLLRFRTLVDQYYNQDHAPSSYADRLHISLKALSKLTKKHLHKTPGDVIAEKLIVEAKRQLYLTEQSVKEIAFFLGFKDSYYFSRFFKKWVGIPARVFRQKVGTVQAINRLADPSPPAQTGRATANG